MGRGRGTNFFFSKPALRAGLDVETSLIESLEASPTFQSFGPAIQTRLRLQLEREDEFRVAKCFTELILINDLESSDSTTAYLEHLQAKHPRAARRYKKFNRSHQLEILVFLDAKKDLNRIPKKISPVFDSIRYHSKILEKKNMKFLDSEEPGDLGLRVHSALYRAAVNTYLTPELLEEQVFLESYLADARELASVPDRSPLGPVLVSNEDWILATRGTYNINSYLSTLKASTYKHIRDSNPFILISTEGNDQFRREGVNSYLIHELIHQLKGYDPTFDQTIEVPDRERFDTTHLLIEEGVTESLNQLKCSDFPNYSAGFYERTVYPKETRVVRELHEKSFTDLSQQEFLEALAVKSFKDQIKFLRQNISFGADWSRETEAIVDSIFDIKSSGVLNKF